MNQPRVSIVSPSYQHANFLEDTIVSVLEQGYPDLEYFIMDGGSTDGSVDIIRKYARYLTYWQSSRDAGQVRAINLGLQRATGEIVTFLNSDDFLLPGAIRSVVEAHEQSPDAAGWVGGGYGIALDGYILDTRMPTFLDADGLADWAETWFYQPSCFFSADVARRVGYLDPTYQNAFDLDFWIRISRIAPLAPMKSIISATRVHTESKTLRLMAAMLRETQAIQRKYGYEGLATSLQALIDQAQNQTPLGTKARLMYRTGLEKQKDPDRYLQFPRPSGIPGIEPQPASDTLPRS
jgi:glycosyltransferase involved in cell wall biosynthesis